MRFMKNIVKIVLCGPAGAGKDTHAEVLAKFFSIPAISVGSLLRAEIARDSAIGRRIANTVARGDIVPSEIATQLLRQELEKHDHRHGYILNGYPRTLPAVEQYMNFDRPTHVVHLMIDDDEMRRRLRHRQREDDTEASIENRIRRYHEEEQPVYTFWKSQRDVFYQEFSTNEPFLDVSRRVIAFLQSYA